MARVAYEFAPYDVLQIARNGIWRDFATLRTEDDAARAVRLVERGEWEGEFCAFQITDGRATVKLESR